MATRQPHARRSPWTSSYWCVAVANSRKCETNYSRCSWNRESKKPKTFFLNLSSSAVVAQVACRLRACLLRLCHTTAPPCRHAATRAWLTTASTLARRKWRGGARGEAAYSRVEESWGRTTTYLLLTSQRRKLAGTTCQPMNCDTNHEHYQFLAQSL